VDRSEVRHIAASNHQQNSCGNSVCVASAFKFRKELPWSVVFTCTGHWQVDRSSCNSISCMNVTCMHRIVVCVSFKQADANHFYLLVNHDAVHLKRI